MVAEDDVLQHEERIRRQARGLVAADLVGHGAEHDHALHGVADQVSLGGVGKSALPGELGGLAEVVEEEAHEHQVAVEPGIEGKHRFRQVEELERVLEQAADPRVVHAHRGRRLADAGHEGLVGEVRVGERAHGRVRERAHDAAELVLHHRDVLA